jgi:hypothetical protein
MKIERQPFHRKGAKNAEMIHLFSLPLRRRQRKMLMPFGQDLTYTKSIREALGLSLFCPLSRKRKKHLFLCDLRASSPRRYLRGWAARYRFVHGSLK